MEAAGAALVGLGYPESLEQAKGVPGAPSWGSAPGLEILRFLVAPAQPPATKDTKGPSGYSSKTNRPL
jgi:hypothetical protein